MANWAWPHTPASNYARIVLTGGPFDGEWAAFVPPDTTIPVQVVWAAWFPWGFAAYLYEWHGERTMDQGRTAALVFTCTGRTLTADEIPPLMAEEAETWAEGASLAMSLLGVP